MSVIEGWLQPYLPGSGRLAIDIGANIGSYTELLAGRFERVDAFEPNPQVLRVLHAAVDPLENVDVHEVALGAASGELALHLFHNSAQATAFAAADLDSANPGESVGEATVGLCSLDQLGYQTDPVDFIKLDVEGYECEVLHGAEATLWKNHPQMLIEIHSIANGDHAAQLLTGLGYALERIAHPSAGVHDGHHWLHAYVTEPRLPR